jgi:hypothetical protein
MQNTTRRRFLADVGHGALIASLGTGLATDLGFGRCLAAESAPRLQFGELDSLVGLMADTPIEQFLPRVVGACREGATAKQLVAAAALANARALGGHDYIGYHALMALAPAFAMAGNEPRGRQLLPIMKVLYRNTKQIQDQKEDDDAMHPVEASAAHTGSADELRALVRQADLPAAEAMLARMVADDREEAFNDLQPTIQDDVNVHRVVLVWRSWSLLPLAGAEHAHTLLRQSVRYCVDFEQERIAKGGPEPTVRQVLPKLLDQYKLHGAAPGARRAGDDWVDQLAGTIHHGSREEAAEAVAAALAEGFAPSDIAEAMSLAANRLLLTDPGRPEQYASANKPAGSVHGDSVGVHASDAANAWRNIALAGNPHTAVTSLIVGAFHTGGQKRTPSDLRASAADLESIRNLAPEKLLAEIDAAIKSKDQRRAAALTRRYGNAGLAAPALCDLLRQFAISEDGALHAEKYYQTAMEEFANLRPALRWGQLVGLARVSASEYGYPAPGVSEAARLLA